MACDTAAPLTVVLDKLKRAGVIIVLVLAVVYVVDYGLVQYRIRTHREPLGEVQVQRFYAVHLKSRKTEYMFDEPMPRTCVHALFPHDGNPPCWYLVRHKRQQIDIQSSPMPSP